MVEDRLVTVKADAVNRKENLTEVRARRLKMEGEHVTIVGRPLRTIVTCSDKTTVTWFSLLPDLPIEEEVAVNDVVLINPAIHRGVNDTF